MKNTICVSPKISSITTRAPEKIKAFLAFHSSQHVARRIVCITFFFSFDITNS
ncbi:hypothetical protein Hanom_Chr10g00907571 [Helianthus anomalus]